MEDRLLHAPCGYISISRDGKILAVNHTFLEQMQFEREQLLNCHIESLMTVSNKLIFHSYFYPFINLHGKVEELVISLKNNAGELIPFLINGKRLIIEGIEVFDLILMQMGKRMHYEGELRTAKKKIEEAYWHKNEALEELTLLNKEIEMKQEELIAINETLMEMSVTDKLTGLKNRHYFQEKLDEQVIHFARKEVPFSLMIIDIDHFKHVNDTFGHPTGDVVLEQLALIIKQFARASDMPVRYGGEEFVMIMPKTSAEQAIELAEQLRQMVEAASWVTGALTVSIGISTYTSSDNSSTILKKADMSLYYSKEHGRNRVSHFDTIQ